MEDGRRADIGSDARNIVQASDPGTLWHDLDLVASPSVDYGAQFGRIKDLYLVDACANDAR